MKNRNLIFAISILFVLFIGVVSVSAEAAPQEQAGASAAMVLGAPVKVGNGTGYSWVSMSHGAPAAIGVLLTESALSGLPDKDIEYMLPLPSGLKVAPYDHITIDWNVHGHIPTGVYDTPHFDIHFYMIDLETRDKITATGEDLARVNKRPADKYIPEGYIPAPGGEVPRMGSHWIDPSSPEFNGKPFTKTFIYGFYNGSMAFLEPMVSLDYLKTKPDVLENIKLPKEYEAAGYYPTAYAVKYDPAKREYLIMLTGLRNRKAGT